MKIRITNDMKKVLTVSEMPTVRKIINDFKEYGKEEFHNDVETAVSLASGVNGSSFEILKAEAEIAKNCRASGFFGDAESPNIDIWIKIYAYHHYYGFYEIGVYLSDLWQLSGENQKEIKSHMYILRFSRSSD